MRRIGYHDLEEGWLAGPHLLSTRERIDSAFRRGLESEDRYIVKPTIEEALFCYRRRSVENANVEGRLG